MQNRSHGSSSLAEEAPPPTQCKHTHIEASTVSLFTTRTKIFNSPDTLYTAFTNSDSVSFTKTQARYTILLPPPPPPPEQRPDWQAASRCHILSAGRSKPRRIRGASTLQRTNNKTLPLRWAEQRREAQNSENGLGSESRSLKEIIQRTSKTLSREAKPRAPHTRKCDQSASSKTPYPTEHNKEISEESSTGSHRSQSKGSRYRTQWNKSSTPYILRGINREGRYSKSDYR